MRRRGYFLSVSRCPHHPDFWAISLDDALGGVRLTPSKCCGRWDGVSKRTGQSTTKGPYVEFSMSANDLDRAAKSLMLAANQLRVADAVAEAVSGEVS